jgi:hypothetical protein
LAAEKIPHKSTAPKMRSEVCHNVSFAGKGPKLLLRSLEVVDRV